MPKWTGFYRIGYGHARYLDEVDAATDGDAFDWMAKKHRKLLEHPGVVEFVVTWPPYFDIGFCPPDKKFGRPKLWRSLADAFGGEVNESKA